MPDRAHARNEGGGASFDRAAGTYDATFTNTHLGRLVRAAVRRELRAIPPGADVLELGCGTGEDACWLAERGHAVTATDASELMLAETAAKAVVHGVAVELAQVDLRDVAGALPGRAFGAAFSNFGPLNCVEDRVAVGRWLASLLPPGAPVIAVVMGPLCPWEWLWYGARGQLRQAARRFRPGGLAHAGEGGQVRVWYPSARRLRKEWAPWFRHVRTRGVGVLLPPSDVAHVVERAPRLFTALAKAEGQIDASRPARWLNDHYLAVFERR